MTEANINIEEAVKALERRGIRASVVEDVAAAREYLLQRIPPGATVGIGGSMTIKELGIYDLLRERGNTVFWHWQVPPEQMKETVYRASGADCYLCSANALTADGKIINTDGAGNRVGSTIFGPSRVIFVVGENKLVRDEEEGRERIRKVAAPLNARRLGLSNPCVDEGCTDCRAATRICSVTAIIEGPLRYTELEVLIVKARLGF